MNKGKLLKTVGWSAIVAGAYAVYLGSLYDNGFTNIRPDENIIDAEFTVIED